MMPDRQSKQVYFALGFAACFLLWATVAIVRDLTELSPFYEFDDSFPRPATEGACDGPGALAVERAR